LPGADVIVHWPAIQEFIKRSEMEYENCKLKARISQLEAEAEILKKDKREACEEAVRMQQLERIAQGEIRALQEKLRHEQVTIREDMNELRARLRREEQIVDRLLGRDL
jgi:predicted  nucleic acid-binding Zn-ribbon protein